MDISVFNFADFLACWDENGLLPVVDNRRRVFLFFCCCFLFLAAQIKKRIRVVPPRFKKKRFGTVNDVGVAPADFFVWLFVVFLVVFCCFLTIIYYDIDPQSANFRDNPIHQATKRHLNNS